MLWEKEKSTGLYVHIFEGLQELTSDMLNSFEMQNVITMNKKDESNALKYRLNGNAHFGRKEFEEALEMYNKSLCFAENGSENMGMAYANRAGCFLLTNKFERCLADIKLAKKANYPQHLMHKLEKREANCLKRMETAIEIDFCEPKLSYDADPIASCFIDGLRIEQNDEYGRHITTQCDLKIGDTVIVEEAYVLLPPIGTYRRCTNCLKQFRNFIPCTNCTTAIFCNEQCFNAANEKFHNFECQLDFSAFDDKDNSLHTYLRFVVRAVFIALSSFSSIAELMEAVDEFKCDEPNDFKGLGKQKVENYHYFFKLGNKLKLGEANRQNVILYAYIAYCTVLARLSFIRGPLTENEKLFLSHLTIHHGLICSQLIVQMVEPNNGANTTLKDMTLQMFAHGFHFGACSLNHSCFPNLAAIHFDNKVVCRVLQPIKRGEQLFLSYLQFDGRPASERKHWIKINYEFECKCLMCTNNYPPFKVANEIEFKLTRKVLIESEISSMLGQEIDTSALKNVERLCINYLQTYEADDLSDETLAIQKVLTYVWCLQFPKY